MLRSFAKWILGAALLAGALVLACSDKGTGPRPEQYCVLVADPVKATIWFADPSTDSVVSVWSIGSMIDPIVSLDGKYLYLSIVADGCRPGGLYKYDLRTRDFLGFLPGAGGLTLAQGGNLLLAERNDGLNFIDPTEFRVREVRQRDIEALHGQLDATIVLGRPHVTGMAGVLAIYDYVIDSYDTVTVAAIGTVYGAFPHPDHRRALVVAGSRLYSVDLATRQAEFICQLRGFGYSAQVIFTRSGERAYVGSGLHGEEFPDQGFVLAIDCTQSRCAVTDTIQLSQPVTSLALSPDEGILYIGTGPGWTATGKVLVAATEDFGLTGRTIEHPAMYDPEYIMILPSLALP